MAKRIKETKENSGSNKTYNKRATQKTGRGTRPARVSRGTNSKRNDSSNDCDNTRTNGSNDVSWYTNNMALVANAGNFSFNNAAGTNLPGIWTDGVSRGFTGVFEYVVQLMPGVSDSAFSPINIAARALYDRVNYKNSRNFSYDAPDLMMYMYGVSSAYAYWAWMVRVYGIMNTYSQINRYVPDVLVKATGADPNDIRLNMAQFRYYINLYARKINVLAVPTGMPLFNRYMWLFSNVYMDADNIKAGLYISRPYGFFKYLENTKTGGACITKVMPKEFMTLNDIINYGNDIAEALLASQDINNMSTDVLKAFEGQVMTIPDLGSDYFVKPVFNTEVLEQIHNLRAYGDYVIGGTSSGSDGVVTVSPSGNLIQDPTNGYLSFELELSDAMHYAAYKDSRIAIDSWKSNPSPEDVFVMTRLLSTIDRKTAKLKEAGSDIVLKMRCWYSTTDDSTGGAMMSNGGYFTSYLEAKVSEPVANYVGKLIAPVSWADKFDYCPLLTATFITSDNKINNSLIFNDVFNYTSIDDESIRK